MPAAASPVDEAQASSGCNHAMKCRRGRDEFSLDWGCPRHGRGGAQPWDRDAGGREPPEGSSQGALSRDPFCFGAEWGVLPSEVPPGCLFP